MYKNLRLSGTIGALLLAAIPVETNGYIPSEIRNPGQEVYVQKAYQDSALKRLERELFLPDSTITDEDLRKLEERVIKMQEETIKMQFRDFRRKNN